jgi:hypothetical protein
MPTIKRKKKFSQITIEEKIVLKKWAARNDNYIVEKNNSFIKVSIKETKYEIQIIFINSKYENEEDYIHLMNYVCFKIGFRKINKFKSISLLK